MTPNDLPAFQRLITGVYAYHRQPLTDVLLEMYWRGCERWTFEQVSRAVERATRDPELGRFPPKIADLTRILEGTATDRAQLAWGKVLEAISSVGSYTDVVFDDPAIHAVVEDLGGWPKLCRTPTDELGYVQHRFTESHRAYVGRGAFEYPRRLGGERSPDSEYEKKGIPPPRPAFVGDREACRKVYEGGSAAGKVSITFNASLDGLLGLQGRAR